MQLTEQQLKIYKQLQEGCRIMVDNENYIFTLIDTNGVKLSGLALKTFKMLKENQLIVQEKEVNGVVYYKTELTQLERAMYIIDNYLNAGSKEERRLASIEAKKLYKEYYGKEYKNRRDR